MERYLPWLEARADRWRLYTHRGFCEERPAECRDWERVDVSVEFGGEDREYSAASENELFQGLQATDRVESSQTTLREVLQFYVWNKQTLLKRVQRIHQKDGERFARLAEWYPEDGRWTNPTPLSLHGRYQGVWHVNRKITAGGFLHYSGEPWSTFQLEL